MKTLQIEATTENLSAVTDFIDACLEEADCPMKVQMQIDLALEEAFINIAHYAYAPDTGEATVCVDLENEPRAVCITLIDSGKPYDPTARTDPDITLSAEERKIGGLGIFLVKKTMDDVQYTYKDGKNVFMMKKIL